MKINTIKIKNFRGIPDMEISLERISFFTGPCGAGKTSVLKAFNFALTGDVKKDDIREQSDRASATIVFEDQSSIQRICKLSAATQVKVNGKNSTAKAADEFLQAKLGTSTDIFQAMCKTDFFEVLSQKEQTEFFLSILPTKISFEKLCEFIGENNKKLTEEEKTTLKTAFANISDPFGLDEIDMAYKYFYQKRKEKKAFVENLKPRAVFDMSILPEESKENLQKSLEDVIRKETLAKEYQKNLNEYNRQVKMKADSDVRLKKLKEEYKKYSSVEKPDPDYKEKQESEKKQFENAIHNCQTAISTIKGNLELLEKTLKSLNTNVCPISSRLICTSDRTPLKSEFEDQIQKSKDGIKKNTDFIKRCEKEVQIRTERLDAYQKQQISYNNKKNLHDQIQNYVPITVMEKPEEVKAPDMMVKQEIQSKISKYTSFENAKKAKCELEEEQKKLRILENLVLYLDSKTGVRGYILKKVVEPFTKMCNQKASKFHNMELKISFDNGIEFYGKTENSNGFVPIHRLSSGEHVFATYLLCTLIHQITKASYLVIDNMDKLDAKEANEVSERLGKEPSNPKLLGAWEALTSVMKASALFDEYNDLRKNNSDLSWDEIERKYPEDRSEMSEEREMLFVNDCFECFEKEGFAKKFWSPFGDDKERIGQSFKVVGRCSTKDSDLSSLPMWNIKFSDGTVIGAYPEEIIPREMKENGCPLEGIE